jgi:hypothetical protein
MTDPSEPAVRAPAKWWASSLTVWGALVTALATVLPIVGPFFGLNVTSDLAQQLGDQMVLVVQAVGGLAGTILTICGRARATTPLARRRMNVRLTV